MSKRKAEQPQPDGEAASDRSTRLHSVAAAAATAAIAHEQQRQPQQQPTAAFAAGAPFQRLATVELQLIMQHCDFKTLLALARCSRFALSAASHPFAWRALPPLSFPTTVADLGGRLRGSRLLAHCDVALRWLPSTQERWQPDVDDAELAAIESVPRLVELDVRAREVEGSQMKRLLCHSALAGLTALHSSAHAGRMDADYTSQLLCQTRLRTLSLRMSHDPESDPRLLASLPQLPALTDLSLSASCVGDDAVDAIGRCASLRRLHLSSVEPADVFAVLTSPARAWLESLSLRNVWARPPSPDGAAAADVGADSFTVDVESWKASVENLQSLRSLSLQYCSGHDVIFAGAAAALVTGTALRSLTALRADTLKMDAVGGSLIPQLAAHCPQLRRLHIHDTDCDFRYNPGALVGLPLLSGLNDLRLQCGTRPPNDDELAVGRCTSLTRLHLSDIRSSSLHSILRSPLLQQLESLTLESVDFDRHDFSDGPGGPLILDWSACFANLRSLRALSLDACHYGDLLLAGVQAACPPLLFSMRFRHHSRHLVVPALQLLPALLVQVPAVRVELIKEAPPLGGDNWSLDKSRQADELHAAWDELKRNHPARVTITVLDSDDYDPFGSWRD